MPVSMRFFKLMESIERKAAYTRGKGFGHDTAEQEVRIVSRLLGVPLQLALDVGANVGAYAAELIRLNPGITVHAFEPSSLNLEKLRVRFAGDSRVIVVPYALHDRAGPATLFSDRPGSGLGGLTKRQREGFDTEEAIATKRFEDYWVEELDERVIDLAKLDIEGHELDALRGFGRAISATRVIQFEFGGCNIDTRTYFRDFFRFFTQEHDFELFRIAPLGLEKIRRYHEASEFFHITNYVAVNTLLS